MNGFLSIIDAKSLNIPLSECEFAFVVFKSKESEDEIKTALVSKSEISSLSKTNYILEIIPTIKNSDGVQNFNRIEWTDLYKTKLCIEHHLNECSRKFNLYVDNEAYVRSTTPHISSIDVDELQKIATKELDKELVDLFLLIESYLFQSNKTGLIKERIKRFQEKRNLSK